MLRISIFLITVVSLLIFSVSNATEVILEDTPNVGDTTTITTITSGNPASTGNLVSQDFDDGSWVGTMFPDSSDINESTWLTGKHGKYAETVIDSDDPLDVARLNTGRKNWSMDHYLEHHCARGKMDYKICRVKMDAYGLPVAEAMVLLTLADAFAEKFGGDSADEMARNIRGYLDNLAIR